MIKDQAGQNVTFLAVDSTDGEATINVGTPTIFVDKDGVQGAAAGGTASMLGNGSWNYTPTQGETNAGHVQFTFKLAGAITTSRSFDPIDVSLYKADVSGLSTFDATTDTVTTDTASRDASKADVTGLSTFDATTDEVTTDAASRTASQADLSGLDTEVAKIIKSGEQANYASDLGSKAVTATRV